MRGAAVVGAMALLMGCPKDPDEVNPRRDVPSVDVVEVGDVTDAGATDADVTDARDAGADEDATSADVTDAGATDAGATDAGVSIAFTFVSGVVTGSSGDASINARFVWHGSIRGQSDGGATRIEAFFR